jgi:hypothetical protein
LQQAYKSFALPTWHVRANASSVFHPAQLSIIYIPGRTAFYKMSNNSDIIEPSLHKTATNITLSPELFEKLYLTPKVPHVGDAYKRYANPTPMGFVGFVISTFSFAMVMMGWGGAAGLSGVAGIFFFTGPVLLLLGTIFEWVMGNFFPVSAPYSREAEAWCSASLATSSRPPTEGHAYKSDAQVLTCPTRR